jgi:hypothetical protein
MLAQATCYLTFFKGPIVLSYLVAIKPGLINAG